MTGNVSYLMTGAGCGHPAAATDHSAAIVVAFSVFTVLQEWIIQTVH